MDIYAGIHKFISVRSNVLKLHTAQKVQRIVSWVCLAMPLSTKMKLAMGFVHMLINVEILVLSCALRLSEFCVIL